MHIGVSKSNAFPTKEQELLLQAALLNGADGKDALAQWLDAIDFEGEMDYGSFRLLPLLFHHLKKQGRDLPIMSRLKGIYRYAWFKNQQLFFELGKTLNTLRQAGIPTMVLKGAALTVQVYRNHAIRPMADMDILVPASQAVETYEILRALGWSRQSGSCFEKDLKYRNATGFKNCSGIEFDLHWHPIKDSSIIASQKRYDELFWQSAVPIEIAGEPTLAPGLPESLLLVIAHGIWDNAVPPIRWVADAVFLIRFFQAKPNWQRFILLVRRYNLPLQMINALYYLEETFRAAIPPFVFEKLKQMPAGFPQKALSRSCMGETKGTWHKMIQITPGIVEYLRVSGDIEAAKLLAGFPAYVFYRMHNKKLNDVKGYIFSRVGIGS